MADEGNSVLSQDAIDSLFGEIPAGDPVVDPGTSADGVTRSPTVGDMPEVAVAEAPPAVAGVPAPAAVAAPAVVAPQAAPPAQQMPDARPWLQEGPAAAAPMTESAPAAPAPELAITVAPPVAQSPAAVAPAAPALTVPPVATAPPPAPAAPLLAAAPTETPVEPAAAGISGDDVEAMIAPLQATLAAYEQRFAGIDSALARLTELEGKLSELEKSSAVGGRGGVERRDLHVLQGKIMKQMRSVVDNLQATPAYGLRKTFACSGCGEVGNVAVRVKCTSCERETHVGWFPREAEARHKPKSSRGGRSNARVKPESSGRRSRRARPGQGRVPR